MSKYIINNHLLFGIFLFSITFDATVLGPTRVSFADLFCIAFILLTFKLNNLFVFRFAKVFIYILLFTLLNLLLYLFYDYHNSLNTNLINLFSGMLRPFFFIYLTIFLYSNLEAHKVSRVTIFNAFKIFLIISFIVVAAQYYGIFPALYNNNPSFSETGRWTVFSEGYRPTGLTNESSFFANFLVLAAGHLLNNKVWGLKYKYQNENLIIFLLILTAFFSTSRIAILYIFFLLLFFNPSIWKFLTVVMIALIAIMYDENLLHRLTNLLTMDGDASTFERYGNILGYIYAIVNFEWIVGTGYMNSSRIVLDNLPYNFFDAELNSIVSFSLPLQIALEFGLFSLPLFYIFFSQLIGKKINLPYLSIMLVSLSTGMQNFLFFYIFIGITIYIQNANE